MDARLMKKTKAYLIIGCPGSGKTWVTNQCSHLFEFIHHDLFVGMADKKYVDTILEKSKNATKPLLIEAPFSISVIKDPLTAAGIDVIPVFIQELPHTIRTRYWQRENKDIPNGHLTRQNTYAQRAKEWGAFQGTSGEVLEHLKKIVGAADENPQETKAP
jgi:hypothetical protein